MLNFLKTRNLTLLMLAIFCFSCSGPENKQPEKLPKQELPETADSVVNQPRDGTDTMKDTVETAQ